MEPAATAEGEKRGEKTHTRKPVQGSDFTDNLQGSGPVYNIRWALGLLLSCPLLSEILGVYPQMRQTRCCVFELSMRTHPPQPPNPSADTYISTEAYDGQTEEELHPS